MKFKTDDLRIIEMHELSTPYVRKELPPNDGAVETISIQGKALKILDGTYYDRIFVVVGHVLFTIQ